MKKLFGSALMLGMLMSAPSAHALFKMQVSDGSSTVTLIDGDGVGSNDGSINGLVTCLDCISNSAISASFALGGSKPTLLPAEMDLAYALYTDAPIYLTIKLTDTGFTDPIGAATLFTTDLAGNTNKNTSGITYKVYLDQSNAEFGTGTLLFESAYMTGPFGTNYFGFTNVDTGAGPYSLTMVLTIAHEVCGSSLDNRLCISSGDALLGTHDYTWEVPEPGSILLLGSGLLALGGWVRKRHRIKN